MLADRAPGSRVVALRKSKAQLGRETYLIVGDRIETRRFAAGNQRLGIRQDRAICNIQFERVPLRVAASDEHGEWNRENQRIDERKHLCDSKTKSQKTKLTHG
jgi:hypothetical protein